MGISIKYLSFFGAIFCFMRIPGHSYSIMWTMNNIIETKPSPRPLDESLLQSVLADMKEMDYLRISDLQLRYSISFPKASKILHRLLDLEYLAKEETGHKGHRILKENFDKLIACTSCGKELGLVDKFEYFRFVHRFVMDSEYANKKLDVFLCRDCMVKAIDFLLPLCKLNPLQEGK